MAFILVQEDVGVIYLEVIHAVTLALDTAGRQKNARGKQEIIVNQWLAATAMHKCACSHDLN